MRRSTAPEWLAGCNGCLLFCVRRGAGPKGGRHRYPASVRRPSRTASVFGHRCGSLDSIALAAAHGRVLFQSARCSATFRFSRFRLKVDQRTPHGPHRCALSLKRAAVARSSVAHTTLGWHCCSPERRGPEGTQVTRAVEKWSQRSLSLLVCAGGHLWPPRAARHVVHAPRVRRPSPLKTREAAQGYMSGGGAVKCHWE